MYLLDYVLYLVNKERFEDTQKGYLKP